MFGSERSSQQDGKGREKRERSCSDRGSDRTGRERQLLDFAELAGNFHMKYAAVLAAAATVVLPSAEASPSTMRFMEHLHGSGGGTPSDELYGKRWDRGPHWAIRGYVLFSALGESKTPSIGEWRGRERGGEGEKVAEAREEGHVITGTCLLPRSPW